MASRLDQLKEAFAEDQEDARLYKRLPFPKAVKVVAEYKLMTSQEAQDAWGDKETEIVAQKDALIKALVRLHVHDPSDENADKRGLVDFEKWTGEDLGGPVGFDHRFCEAVGWEPMDASAIVLKCFAGNEIALGSQATELMAWMTDTSVDQLQDFKPGS